MKKITKEQYEQLPDFMKSSYALQDDGSYKLESGDDLGALKRAKEHEAKKRKEETQKRKDLEAQLKALQDKEEADAEEASKAAGDIASLEESYKAKLSKVKGESKTEIDRLKNQISGLLVDNLAQSVAEDISTSPALMVPFIKERLTADLSGDTPVTRILDGEGQISALTIDELKAEFQADAKFKPVLIASKASGGAESDGKSSSPSFSTGGGEAETPLSDMSDEALTAHITRIREERR